MGIFARLRGDAGNRAVVGSIAGHTSADVRDPLAQGACRARRLQYPIGILSEARKH
jgi:hypothetical protein